MFRIHGLSVAQWASCSLAALDYHTKQHAGADLASWDPLLKDDYAPAIVTTLQDENNVQKMMTTEFTDDSWVGRQKIQPVKVGRNYSTGSIGPGGALPPAGKGSYQDFKIPMKDCYGSVGFERWVIEQSSKKKGSWAQVIPQEMDGLVEDMAFRRNVIAWGYGKGILALVNGAHAATATLEIKAPLNVTGTTMANRYLYGDSISGMLIAILDPTTQAIKATATVTAVNGDGTDVTLDTAVTAADGDLIVIAQTATQHSYGKEPEGLLAGIDDGTYVATYHDLSRTTFPLFKAYIVTGVGPFSLDAIQQPIDAVSIRVGGKGIDLFMCEHAVRRAYLALTELDRRYTGADLMRPDGGTAAAKKPTGRNITYGDIPMVAERDCPYGMLFGINKGTWVRYVMDEGSWADEGGSVIKWIQGFDKYMAFFKLFENYHCNKPAANFRLEGITVNQLIVHAA